MRYAYLLRHCLIQALRSAIFAALFRRFYADDAMPPLITMPLMLLQMADVACRCYAALLTRAERWRVMLYDTMLTPRRFCHAIICRHAALKYVLFFSRLLRYVG